MAKSRIYTKQGDGGFTSLVGGKKVPKSSLRIETYGTVDELNAFIALLLEDLENREDSEFLREVQSDLFTIGSYLASDPGFMDCTITEDKIGRIESEIDKADTIVPPLRKFVLPGGCKSNAMAHICRTVCRRAERCINRLKDSEEVDGLILEYINRLSDYFFILARKQNFMRNIDEIVWENTCK